jgi:hypothetical protein
VVPGGKIASVSVLQPIRKTVRFRMSQRLSTDLIAEERQEKKPRRGIPEVVIGNFVGTYDAFKPSHFSARAERQAHSFPSSPNSFTPI